MVMCVTGALEHERPFIVHDHPPAPLSAGSALVRRFLLAFAGRASRAEATLSMRVADLSVVSSSRADAQASAERTGIGGWVPSVRPDGSLDLWSSRWFSLELKRESWPWVYEKADKPSLLIARTKGQEASTWTDNRGNGSAPNMLMTSRYPASAVSMEMSALLKRRGLQASVQWAPRSANREADRWPTGTRRTSTQPHECVIDLATVRGSSFPGRWTKGDRQTTCGPADETLRGAEDSDAGERRSVCV